MGRVQKRNQSWCYCNSPGKYPNSGKEGAGGQRAETSGRPCLVRGWIKNERPPQEESLQNQEKAYSSKWPKAGTEGKDP